MSPSIFSPIRDRQLIPPVTHCPSCGQELYAGEFLLQDVSGLAGGRTLCPGCFHRWVEEQLQLHTTLLAGELGFRSLDLGPGPLSR